MKKVIVIGSLAIAMMAFVGCNDISDGDAIQDSKDANYGAGELDSGSFEKIPVASTDGYETPSKPAQKTPEAVYQRTPEVIQGIPSKAPQPTPEATFQRTPEVIQSTPVPTPYLEPQATPGLTPNQVPQKLEVKEPPKKKLIHTKTGDEYVDSSYWDNNGDDAKK